MSKSLQLPNGSVQNHLVWDQNGANNIARNRGWSLYDVLPAFTNCNWREMAVRILIWPIYRAYYSSHTTHGCTEAIWSGSIICNWLNTMVSQWHKMWVTTECRDHSPWVEWVKTHYSSIRNQFPSCHWRISESIARRLFIRKVNNTGYGKKRSVSLSKLCHYAITTCLYLP